MFSDAANIGPRDHPRSGRFTNRPYAPLKSTTFITTSARLKGMVRYVLMSLALAATAFGQAQQPVAPPHDNKAPESAEHKYAQQKFNDATKQCAGLQAEYEALELKIETIVLKGYSVPAAHPVVTTCTALKERSALLLKDAAQHRAADELHEPSTSGNLTVPDSFHNVGISSSSLIGNCVVTDGPGTREYECETIVKPVAPLDPKRGQ